MKILIVTNLFPPHVLGGYEILCHQVVQELKKRGHEITVLTSDEGNIPSSEGVVRSLKVFQSFDQKVEGSMRKEKLRTCHHNKAVMRQVLATNSYDVIFHWSMLRLTPAAARVAEQSSIPVVYTFNDEHPSGYIPARMGRSLHSLLRWMLDAMLFQSLTNRSLHYTHTTCISKLLKDNLIKAGMPIQESEVIYQGIPIEQFPQRTHTRKQGEPLRLLYAGQLHHYKGVHTLLQALARDTGTAYQCTIVGAGPKDYEQELKTAAQALPIKVEFLGRVDHKQMSTVYQAHDVLVFPSIWPEPFGLTHLEAMASGLAVISTVNGGQGEFLQEGVNALTFEPSQADRLADQLRRLAGDETLYQNLVKQGRRTVEDGFSFTRYVDDLEALLKKAIDQKR